MICGLKRCSGDNSRRKKQEMRLIFELGTLKPNGLNINFYLMRTRVTHALGLSRARTLHTSAPSLSPLVFSYGVCQLATMGFSTLMKGSARNVCTFFNVQ